MAKTETVGEKTLKSKLVPKDLGNPKRVTMLPDGENKLILGTILGMASKVIERKMPNGDVFEGLGGTFEGIPSDPAADTVHSGVCYLPSGFMELFTEPLKSENAPESIQFAFEVAVVKAANPQGYSWSFTPLKQIEEGDPLKALKGELQSKIKRLAVPGSANAAVKAKASDADAKASAKK